MNGTTGTRCGRIVIAGRPNVGKSTLLNRMVGVHLAATTPKPQTTRHRILGIRTEPDAQMVFIDTPGIHSHQKRLLNRRINRTALAALEEADLVLFVIEAGQWRREDQAVLDHLGKVRVPILLAVNKVDRIRHKADLLPFLAELAGRGDFAEIVPLSAYREKSVRPLLDVLRQYLPHQPFCYPEDELTDRSMRFLSAELVREQLMQALQEEVPYSVAVEIESFREQPHRIDISALIYVEREGQKRIVIGEKGRVLKHVGTIARQRIAALAGRPVHLKLWVKVKPGWADDPRWLDRFDVQADGEG